MSIISIKEQLKQLNKKDVAMRVAVCLAGSFLQAFAIYNIHSISDITEGGIFGLELLANHWLGISPAITGFLLTAVCFILGWRTFGTSFLVYSGICAAFYSCSYAVLEHLPRLFPGIGAYPLLAAVLGAVLIGLGAGVCVRVGGATGGDDALAMSLSERFHVQIRWIYLASDVTVLLMSLSYIPLKRIAWSLLTVFLSGQVINWVVAVKLPPRKEK